MSRAMKPSRPSPHGATRRRPVTQTSSPIDRWLDRLVTLFVLTALIVGGLALILTLAIG